jgi:hypothetical protein
LQERIQERFRYGSQNGIDFSSTLHSLGYQSENQFMQALQTQIQNAQAQFDIKKAIDDCLTIGQTVQQMEQALNQEITHQQGPNPSNGAGTSSGPDDGVGNSTGGNGSGGSNTGNGGVSKGGK